jgi:hypothetical protein
MLVSARYTAITVETTLPETGTIDAYRMSRGRRASRRRLLHSFARGFEPHGVPDRASAGDVSGTLAPTNMPSSR